MAVFYCTVILFFAIPIAIPTQHSLGMHSCAICWQVLVNFFIACVVYRGEKRFYWVIAGSIVVAVTTLLIPELFGNAGIIMVEKDVFGTQQYIIIWCWAVFLLLANAAFHLNSYYNAIVEELTQGYEKENAGEETEEHIKKFNLLYLKIIDLMEKKQPYQNTDYSITQLAIDLKSNTTYLNMAIRANNGQSFNILINHWRINHFKELCRQPENANLNIRYLFRQSGFHSQATFNRVFKQLEGITPTAYLETLRDKNPPDKSGGYA